MKILQEEIRSILVFHRPAEVYVFKGDYSKAKRILGWEPKVKFEELVKIMVKADLENLEKYKGE